MYFCIKYSAITQFHQNKHNFSEKEFSTGRITCDLYNVLSRGLQQKVIGVSLYGNDPLYYESIKIISKSPTNSVITESAFSRS